ncbi:MAG: sulfatase-like hydrolase/transferase [Rhodothermales bacterium]
MAAGGRTRNPAGDAYNTRRHEAPEGISPVDYTANFADFLASREAGQPFYFWYGAHEPHRVYKPGIGRAHGKPLAAAEVPPFLPDAPEVRDDLLDYAYEIEWFDAHLVQMLKQLEEAGELANTIVIVTSDNGMSFPRAKANAYEYGIHVPLAVMWPARVPGGRRVDDLVSLVDIAPTLLAAANVPAPAMTGTSLMPLLLPAETGGPEPGREAVFAARERHSSSRYNSLGYPQRAMRTGDALYIWNPAPERWPAGAPQAIGPDGAPGPLHGAYHDIDAAPTLDFLVAHRDEPGVGRYFHLAVDHRPARELCAVTDDPGCLVNLAGAPAEAARVGALHARLLAFLQSTGDPRALGEGDVFETYRRYSPLRTFPPPQWVLDGQPAFKPDWIVE